MAVDPRVMGSPGAAGPAGSHAAFLVDADNFSDGPALELALAHLQARTGRVNVCRAYGGPMRLQSLAGVWRTLGARTFPNLALEKNTTDAALIADAVALHFQQGVRLFGIASGDADFAPLAVRLREWGCEVWCFSIVGILFAGAEAYYDHVVRYAPSTVFANDPLPPAAAVKKPPAPPAAVAVKAPQKEPLPCGPASSKAKAVADTVLPKAPFNAVPEAVQSILQAMPALRGAPQHLAQVVPVLRQKDILGKTTKSTVFFAVHAVYFKLSPAHQPTHVAYAPPGCMAPATATPQREKSAPTTFIAARASVQALEPAPVPAVKSWPITLGRRPAPPLLTELHGLRSVLVQRALRCVTVADVLLVVPELLEGKPCALSAVAGRLREKGLLHTSQSALRILERYPGAFEFRTDRTPQVVIYLP